MKSKYLKYIENENIFIIPTVNKPVKIVFESVCVENFTNDDLIKLIEKVKAIN